MLTLVESNRFAAFQDFYICKKGAKQGIYFTGKACCFTLMIGRRDEHALGFEGLFSEMRNDPFSAFAILSREVLYITVLFFVTRHRLLKGFQKRLGSFKTGMFYR